jgi:uncharacterized protein (TIGR03437 family)
MLSLQTRLMPVGRGRRTCGAAALLLLSAGIVNAQNVFSDFGDLGSYSNNGWCVSGANNFGCGTGVTRWIAASFIPKTTTTLVSISLAISNLSGTNGAIIQLASDSNGSPGTVLDSWTLTNLSESPQVTSVNATAGVTLLAGQVYWVEAQGSAADSLDYWWTNDAGFGGGFQNVGGAGWTPLTGYYGGETLPAFSVTGFQPLGVSCTSLQGPTAVEQQYSASCTAVGGTAPYSWSIGSGSLPAGLVQAQSGPAITVSGAPTVAGGYSYGLRVTDSSSPQLSETIFYSGSISIPANILYAVSNFGTTLQWQVGRPLDPPGGPYQLILLYNATSSARLVEASGLPPGIRASLEAFPANGGFGPSYAVFLRGTPLAPFLPGGLGMIGVTDSSIPSSAGVDFNISVTQTTWSPVVPEPSGTVGSLFSGQMTASGGTPPYTWRTIYPAGVPPPFDVSYSPPGDTGLLVGYPTQCCQQTVQVTVTDANLVSFTGAYTFRVSAASNQPKITSVVTVDGGPYIAQDTWVAINGTNLAPTSTPAAGTIWSDAPEFAFGKMPTQLGNVSVTVNSKAAFVEFVCSATTDPACSSDQINILTPLDSTLGPVPLVVTTAGVSSAPQNVTLYPVSPAFLLWNQYVVAKHPDGSPVGPTTLFPGSSTPAQPGETISLYAVGFGLPAAPLVSGSATQSGALPAAPVIQIGGTIATVPYAALISPGLYQFNVTIPSTANGSDNTVSASYNGFSTPAGEFVTVAGPSSSAALAITSFQATPANIQLGQTSTLTWGVANATSVSIDNAVGSVGASGSIAVAPPTTTTYTLTATANGATVTATATISVAGGAVSPGSMLSIGGSFDPGATTYMVFASGSNQQIQVAPVAVTANTVTAQAPPFMDPRTMAIGPGAYSVTVVQNGTPTSPVNIQVSDLPTTNVAPGQLVLAALNQLSMGAGSAAQTWNAIAAASGNAVNVSGLNLPGLQSALSLAQTEIQSIVAGSASQVTLGQVGGQSVYLDVNSLALLDRLLLAYISGAAGSLSGSQQSLLGLKPRGTVVDDTTQVVTGLQSLLNSTLPAGIRSNAKLIRGVFSVATGLAVLATAPADVALVGGATAGAIVWFATTWVSAAIASTMEGSGALILSDDPTKVPDFSNTIGILQDGYLDQLVSSLEDSVAGLAGEGGQIVNTIANTVQGIISLMNPQDPSSVASQTIANAPSNAASPISLSGTWTGSYQYAGGSCDWNSAGQFTMSLTGGSSGVFSGTASITGVQSRNVVTCQVSGDLNSASGDVSFTVSGASSAGVGTLTGQASFAMSDGTSVTFTLSGTVVGTSITGSLTTGTPGEIGSFQVNQ